MGALMRSEKSAPLDVDAEEVTMQGEQYLTFLAGEEVFAIGIADIKEIIEYRDPTSVPMMPSYLRGVINLRGRVVPVIDLLVRFDRKSSEVSRRTCIVILEVYQDDEQQYLGVVVDTVKAVLDIADEDIEPPPSFGARLRNDFVSGMGKIDGEFVVILDISNVLSIDELSMLSELGSSGPLSAEAEVSQQDSVTNKGVENLESVDEKDDSEKPVNDD